MALSNLIPFPPARTLSILLLTLQGLSDIMDYLAKSSGAKVAKIEHVFGD